VFRGFFASNQVTATYGGDIDTCSFTVIQHGQNTPPYMSPAPSGGTYRVSDFAPNASDPFVVALSAQDAQVTDSFTITLQVYKDEVEMTVAQYSQFVTYLDESLSFFTDQNSLAGTYKFGYTITDDNSCNSYDGTHSSVYYFYYEILLVNHKPVFDFEVAD